MGEIFCGYAGMGELLTRNAACLGRKTGLVFEEQRLSWSELNARACRFANALAAAGVRQGERVAICARNSHRWVEAMFGLAKLGAVLVTVNNRLAAGEIAWILKDSGARAVLCGAQEEERVREALADNPQLRQLVQLDGEGDADALGYEKLVQGGEEHEPRLDAPLRWEDPLMLLYTSGTTGFPKGAVYTHGGALAGMFIHLHAIGSRTTHRVMLPSPLYSAAGMAGICCSVYVGSTTVIVNFDARTVLQTLQEERISFTNLVPTTLQRLLGRPEMENCDLSALELLLYGGAPMPATVLLEAARRLPGCGFRQTFASTETGCAGTVLEPADHRQALDDPAREHLLLSCGRAQLGVELRITDADGAELPPGETGEIAVRSVANCTGFWNNPEAGREAFRDGWLYTGDMARCDEEGLFYLVDRKKDLIISGALNVYPSEVERVLLQHPAVYEAAVIGVPSVEWGEEVKAVVVQKPGMQPTESELIDFCGEQLAGFKKPRSIDFVDALPRNPTGKILRRQVREPYWRERERKIG